MFDVDHSPTNSSAHMYSGCTSDYGEVCVLKEYRESDGEKNIGPDASKTAEHKNGGTKQRILFF